MSLTSLENLNEISNDYVNQEYLKRDKSQILVSDCYEEPFLFKEPVNLSISKIPATCKVESKSTTKIISNINPINILSLLSPEYSAKVMYQWVYIEDGEWSLPGPDKNEFLIKPSDGGYLFALSRERKLAKPEQDPVSLIDSIITCEALALDGACLEDNSVYLEENWDYCILTAEWRLIAETLPASQKQKSLLEKHGYRNFSGLSKLEAHSLIERLFAIFRKEKRNRSKK